MGERQLFETWRRNGGNWERERGTKVLARENGQSGEASHIRKHQNAKEPPNYTQENHMSIPSRSQNYEKRVS
jgi:hypothetical protein